MGLKLWLFDADVIIKFFELGIFDRLVQQHRVHVASSVVDEVRYFTKKDSSGKTKVPVYLRTGYIDNGLVTELSASPSELQTVLERIPPSKRQAIQAGEIESLAVLSREVDLTMCTFDHFAIRCLPFVDVCERAVSAEKLCQESGFTLSPKHVAFDVRLTEAYFRDNLKAGNQEYVTSIVLLEKKRKR